MALIKCPNCGAMISDKAEKCVKCATDLSHVDFQKESKCPECGKQYSLDDRFCLQCGFPFYDLKEENDKFLIAGKVIKEYSGEAIDVIIPVGPSEIGEGAFKGKDNIQSVRIPYTITRIGKNAFSDCTSLKKVVLPSSIVFIDEEAFSNCSNLEEIYLPASYLEIDKTAFLDCPNISTVYWNCIECTYLPKSESLWNWSESPFWKNKSIKKVYFGETVKKIPAGAFNSCESLSYVFISKSVTDIEADVAGCAFENCSSLKEVVFEDPKNWLIYLLGYEEENVFVSQQKASNPEEVAALMKTYINKTKPFLESMTKKVWYSWKKHTIDLSKIEKDKQNQEKEFLLKYFKSQVMKTLGNTNCSEINQYGWFDVELPYFLTLAGRRVGLSIYARLHTLRYDFENDIVYSGVELGFYSECKKECVNITGTSLFNIVLADSFLGSRCINGDAVAWRYTSFNPITDKDKTTYVIPINSNNAVQIIQQFIADVAKNITGIYQFHIMEMNGLMKHG